MLYITHIKAYSLDRARVHISILHYCIKAIPERSDDPELLGSSWSSVAAGCDTLRRTSAAIIRISSILRAFMVELSSAESWGVKTRAWARCVVGVVAVARLLLGAGVYWVIIVVIATDHFGCVELLVRVNLVAEELDGTSLVGFFAFLRGMTSSASRKDKTRQSQYMCWGDN